MATNTKSPHIVDIYDEGNTYGTNHIEYLRELETYDGITYMEALYLCTRVIVSTNDNYINISELCKSVNRKFEDWLVENSSLDLICTLGDKLGKRPIVRRGRRYLGSYVHYEIADKVLQWCNSKGDISNTLLIMEHKRNRLDSNRKHINLIIADNLEKKRQLKKQGKIINALSKKIRSLENRHTNLLSTYGTQQQDIIYDTTSLNEVLLYDVNRSCTNDLS